jgi:GNAT superfamily N-acetyltransferase
MNAAVTPVTTRAELARFIRLPWTIYRRDRNWVPPLVREMRKALSSGAEGVRLPHELFLAVRSGRDVGRIYVGFDPRGRQSDGAGPSGFFSLFECEDEAPTAAGLFEAAGSWLQARGIDTIKGPVPTVGFQGDEYKGLLLDAFDLPPVIMTSYNPPYYQRLIEQCGFEKELDLFAYRLLAEELFPRSPERVVRYAQRRYGFTLETVNLQRREEHVGAIKHILDRAMPAEWPDIVVPTLEELHAMAKRMAPIADPDLIVIASAGDEPIGFGLALPDYNQVLIHLNGRLTPLALARYFWYKRRINCARIFILFVVPAFRRKGVAHAIYHRIFVNGVGKGYTRGEGSTIGETNTQMRADMESIGATKYKTYRIYRRDLRRA